MCPSPIVYQSICVPVPSRTSPLVSQSHRVPVHMCASTIAPQCLSCTSTLVCRSHCVPVHLCTVLLRPSAIVYQSTCVPVPLCTANPIVYQSHYVPVRLCIPVPLCTLPNCLSPILSRSLCAPVPISFSPNPIPVPVPLCFRPVELTVITTSIDDDTQLDDDALPCTRGMERAWEILGKRRRHGLGGWKDRFKLVSLFEIINILLIVVWVDKQRLVCACHCVCVCVYCSIGDNSN